MSRIYVCGLDELYDQVERLRPARVVSLLPPAEQPPTPLGIAASDHLRVPIDDIDEPQPGLRAPARAHVATLIDFFAATPPRSSILIHCLAGVSRSPAAALIALALDAPGREHEVAQQLRAAAPFVDPNRLMIEIADALLDRDGRLVAARDAMGPADWSMEMGLFALRRPSRELRSLR